MYIPQLQDISWVLPYRSEALTEYFKAYMIFGQPSVYLFILAAYFWYSGSRFSIFLAFTTCVATFVCNFMKLVFQIPRPPVEYQLIDVSSFGFPSGDVLLVTTFWIVMALHFRSRWLYVLCIFLIPNIMMSRMYLGVHSQLDVTVGMLIGVATAFALNSQRFQILFESWINGEKLKLYWTTYLITFVLVIVAFPETINNPISVSLGAFFGLGLAFSKGIKLYDGETRASLYMISAAITMLALLYIFIPSTFISGQYKWVNQTVKFAIITSYIFYFVPKCLQTIQQDEELRDA